jgi:hypothetical protein
MPETIRVSKLETTVPRWPFGVYGGRRTLWGDKIELIYLPQWREKVTIMSVSLEGI